MRLLICCGCVVVAALSATEAPVPAGAIRPEAPPAVDPAVGGPSIQHAGQTFVLASSSAGKGVETDEYTVAGEKLGDWTQLVTVQRLTVAATTTTEGFVAFFKQKVAEDGASLDVLSQTAAASVFAVRFPKSEQNDEQVMICLSFRDPGKPELLNIVQYALKPARCPVADATTRLKAWRDRFLAQARGLAPASS